MFQCRTRLCLWCKSIKGNMYFKTTSFNAARGFVCGASEKPHIMLKELSSFNAARGFVCGASMDNAFAAFRTASFNAARGFVCGARCNSKRYTLSYHVSMPHAALFVVQVLAMWGSTETVEVSMPHAALFVVQVASMKSTLSRSLFQCRTRLCLWCKIS